MNSVSALNISGQAFAYQRAGKNICIWKLETDFSFKFKLKPEFIYIYTYFCDSLRGKETIFLILIGHK